jgi:AcrR family transcriptional regulator
MDYSHLEKNTFANLAEGKQQAIIKAAIVEFASQGYQKASCNNVVRAANIAKGSLFQYFGSKEGLFLFVFDRFTRKVKGAVKEATAGKVDFFELIEAILVAGLGFIDRYPQYFQMYLRVLFEQEVPRRQELLAQVRLFSSEYFGPHCRAAQEQGVIRDDIAVEMVVFILDAAIDRFLQAYARPYLDSGLGLAELSAAELRATVAQLLTILQDGLRPATVKPGQREMTRRVSL